MLLLIYHIFSRKITETLSNLRWRGFSGPLLIYCLFSEQSGSAHFEIILAQIIREGLPHIFDEGFRAFAGGSELLGLFQIADFLGRDFDSARDQKNYVYML